MHRCFIECDTFKLKQQEIEAMLEAFLIPLKFSTNFILIKRIQGQVFEKFIESNSVEKIDEQGPYYFPCFDIVPFSEGKVF